MRYLLVAAAAMVLLMPAGGKANACPSASPSAQIAATDYSAATAKKPAKTAHMKKHHKPKEKVEYLRAAPM